MANTFVDSNAINLKERIAALEQRTSTPTPESPQPKPTGIPQLTSNVHLRDKIAKFERKGGVPVPRGRFGMGAPPIDSGKPKKQGEFYGNRIPRIASASTPRPVGAQTNKRSISLSVATSDIQNYGASMPRSISPCPSDLDTTNSPLSPDAEKEFFVREMDSPSYPATEIMEAYEDSSMKPSNLNGDIRDPPEDTLGIPTEPNNQEAAQGDASAAADVVLQVVVTESASAQPEDASTVPEAVPQMIITGPSLIQPGQASEDNLDSETLPQPQVKEEVAPADDITSSNKAEETEVERQLNEEVVPPTEPETKHEDESVDNKVDDFSEATSVVEEASSTSVSRSSSLHTLKPIHHATTNIPTADEGTAAPEVPVISLSPPPSAEDVMSPAVPSPLELYSSQGNERGTSRINTGDLPFVASPSSAASSVSSPVEVQPESTSPAKLATRIPFRSFTRSPSPRGLPDIVVPANKEDNVGNVLMRAPREGTLSKVTTVEPPSEAAGLSSKEKVTTPTVTVTSPPVSKTPDSAPAALLYGIPDKRASTPSPSVLLPPSISGVLSPTSDSSSTTQSPLASPTEIVSDRMAIATAGPRIPASTNMTEESGDSGLPASLSPTSPTSRFRNPPAMSATKDRPSTFHAVVHSKVRETAPALPTPTSTSQLLAVLEMPQVKKAKQSGRVEIPASLGTGELASLLHEAALLENALAEGPLDLSLNPGRPAAQEANRRSEEPQSNKEDRQRDHQRGIVHEPSASKGDQSDPGNLKSRLAFRLPLKKKTKHWKASSTANAKLHEDMRIGHSLDTERLAGMSTPTDPPFLKIDPVAAKIARAEEAQPNTPEGFRQDLQYKTPPKSPRLLASFRRLVSTGSTKSLHTSGLQPRRSGSTWSELSSEDSVPVLTPPDASLYFARSDSKDGMSSSQSYRSTQSGPNIPWPSMSPRRTIARAASFAEKIFNRGRTRSNGSTLSAVSAQEPRGNGSLTTSPRKAASSVNLTSPPPSSFRLDLPSLTPSESMFDSPLSGNSTTFSLPNPYSPAKGSASTSTLANRHSPGNESWISDVSQLDPAMFDAFPSVPEQPAPTFSHRSAPPKKAAQHLPNINAGSSLSSFDPFFTNPPAPRSAQLPKKNATLLPVAQPLRTSASVDSTLLPRTITVPNQRPTEHHSGRYS